MQDAINALPSGADLSPAEIDLVNGGTSSQFTAIAPWAVGTSSAFQAIMVQKLEILGNPIAG